MFNVDGHLRLAQQRARANGEHLGIGLSCFVEHTSTGSQDYHKRGVYGLPAFDSATIRVDARGNVSAAVAWLGLQERKRPARGRVPVRICGPGRPDPRKDT